MNAPELRALRDVVAIAPPSRRLALITLAAGSGAVLAAAALLSLSGALISKAALQPPILSLTVLIVGVRATGFVRALLRYAERLASHDLALRALARLRATFCAALVPLVPAGLRSGRGDLLSRFVQDVDTLQQLYVRALGPPAIAALTGVLVVFAAWLVLPAAALVLAAGLLLGGVAVPLVTARAARRAGRRQAGARAQLSAEILEAAEGSAELAACGRAEDRIERVVDADRVLGRLALRDALAGAVASGLGALVQGATVVGVLIVAIGPVQSGALDGILLAALAFLALASFEAVAPLSLAATHAASCASAAGRVTAVIGAEDPVADRPRPRALPPAGALCVEGAALRFDDDGPWVLRGADLRIDPGRAVALVGPSGAGKTTLAELLVRFRDPQHGRVTLGGADVRDLRQDELREAVVLCAQDAALFTTTVAENVRLARPGSSDREVHEALDFVGLGPWLDAAPEGLSTLVGEEGARLSGGQRQRVVLARAVLSDARFVVLDEPTAHLDPPAARDLLERLADRARERGQGLLAIVHGAGDLTPFDDVVELRAGAPALVA
ncbi:MAG: thiol reductant ABC exporter subunit CydC [Thermoleophilia bacterium]